MGRPAVRFRVLLPDLYAAPMNQPTVTLSASECAVAQMLASMRYMTARAAGQVNLKQGSQSPHITDLEGMAAELAFAKHFNVCPDMAIRPVSGGHDAVLKGKTVDVKVTKHPEGQLLAHTKKRLTDSDVYVLLVGEMPTYRIAGYAMADELINPANLTNLGYGPVYGLPQDKLRRFK